MSLRVNLIIQEERRSGSHFNLKSLTRLGKILVPTVILFLIGIQALKYRTTISELRMLKARWEIAEPKQKQSQNLLAQLNYNTRTANELEEWRKSRIDWHKQLQAILVVAPETIQITDIFVSSESGRKSELSPPIRKFTLTIDGKNSGEGAMDYIEIFEKGLKNYSSITGIVESIEVSNYEADTSENATEFDRVFQIECIYKSLPEEPIK